MWLTFINGVKQKELKQYLSNSTHVQKVLPLLVNKSKMKKKKKYMYIILLL